MRFVGDIPAATEARSALPLSQISAIVGHSVEIGREAVRNAFSATLKSVMDVLSTLLTMTNQTNVSEVSFTLMINARGEVSIASLAKGLFSEAAGFEFTIRLRDAQHATHK